MPDPPTRRRGRPPRLSREAIVSAALEHDLDSLTMRQLAKHLGVSHSSLYSWVSGQDELIALIGDAWVDRVLPPASGATEGRAWLIELAVRTQQACADTPGFAARLTRPHRHHQPAFQRLADAVTEAFGRTGLDTADARHATTVFNVAILSWIVASETIPTDRPIAEFAAALVTALTYPSPR